MYSSQSIKNILIAEDEESNFWLLEEYLIDSNVNIIWAPNGKRAVELFNENPQINLILMDIKMPEMSGIEALKYIRALNTKSQCFCFFFI